MSAVEVSSVGHQKPRCIAILGGSFDPVHSGHVALARHCVLTLGADELCLIPTGNPWQKAALHATPEHRIAMLHCAFDNFPTPIKIDQREIKAHTANYTVETLQSLRAELGPDDSLVFLIGADQLHHLDTWHQWQKLFDYAHLCAASRPGFALDSNSLPPAVSEQFRQRAATPEQLRATSHGRSLIVADLDVDISATWIRNAVAHGNATANAALIPQNVLDYIQTHHLYKD